MKTQRIKLHCFVMASLHRWLPEENSRHLNEDSFCDAAAKKYQFINGDYVTVSVDYVYRYYRKYAQGGYDALKPGGRSDIGKVRKLDDDTVSSIKYLHTEYPRLPATMIYQKLIENGTITARKVSLSMADQEKLIRMNALGTVHVNQEFAKYMQKDSVFLDVSSNSAYACYASHEMTIRRSD